MYELMTGVTSNRGSVIHIMRNNFNFGLAVYYRKTV